MDFTNHNNFRDILKDEFHDRCKVNPKYTMGSFSNHLGLKPSRLHDVMNGRYGISESVAKDVAAKLKFTEFKAQFFCDLVESQHGRSDIKKQLAKLRLKELRDLKNFQQLSMDSFKAMSDWYHFALLELTSLDDFKSDVSWAAEKLGINKLTVVDALERLTRLGLLKVDNGQWISTEDFTEVGNNTPSSAIKNYHIQLMNRAQSALLKQPLGEREFTSITFAADNSKIDQAREKIRKLQEELCSIMGETDNKNSVYCLSLQLFNLGQNEEKSDS